MYEIYHPIKCQCEADLTKPEAVEITFSTADHQFDRWSSVAADGQLVDVDDLIANGYHSCTHCNTCHQMLDELDGPEDAKVMDITPAGFRGPNAQANIKRANEAIENKDKLNADLAGRLGDLFDLVDSKRLVQALTGQALNEVNAEDWVADTQRLLRHRQALTEELLLATAGRPPHAGGGELDLATYKQE